MIKVLIVDDSSLVRQILKNGLESDPDIEVVGSASDVYQARDLIVYKKPDVMTLDVEMPRMDGVEFLKRLMPQFPIPVIMVSAMTGPGAHTTLEALEAGAVDFVLKPSSSFGAGLRDTIGLLIEKVKAAALADVSMYKQQNFSIRNIEKKRVLVGGTDKIIGIGASTGGTVALRRMLQTFPADMPGTVVVQHMPPTFTKLFADKLNEVCDVEVREAADGDRIIRGSVLIAPGDLHMRVKRSGGRYVVAVSGGEKVSGHRPSVDVLFSSMAEQAGANSIGVILTGMGSDGAEGLLAMRSAGARTLGQDEQSSVIYGMPHVAFDIGAVEKQSPLHLMTDNIIEVLQKL